MTIKLYDHADKDIFATLILSKEKETLAMLEKDSGSSNNHDIHSNEDIREKLVNGISENECKNETEKNVRNCGLLEQSVLAAIVAIAGVGAGMPIGYSAVLLPQLKAINGSLQIDDEMGSWIASVHSIATPVGAFLSGSLMDYFGRKAAIQIACIPFIVGWICIGLSQKHAVLLIGRILTGAAVSLTLAPCQVYIAEIAHPSIRAVLANIPSASYIFGILLVYTLGSVTEWRLTAGLSILLPGIAALALFVLPESPSWLVRQGSYEAADKACLWLRGKNAIQAKTEVQQLIKRAEEEACQKSHLQSTWATFTTPQVFKPLVIVNIFFLLQTLTGPYLMVFYAVDIISHIGIENINGYFAAVLTAGVRFICALTASVLLAFIGRRVVGVGSALGSGISALSLAVLLYSDHGSNSYLTAACLLCYVAANTTGLLTLPGIVLSEVFPMRARGLAVSFTYTNFNLILFGITKIFPFLNESLGIGGFFLLFGVSSLVTAIFIYCVLPETKGKSLTEIEDYFLQGNTMWITRNKQRE